MSVNDRRRQEFQGNVISPSKSPRRSANYDSYTLPVTFLRNCTWLYELLIHLLIKHRNSRKVLRALTISYHVIQLTGLNCFIK